MPSTTASHAPLRFQDRTLGSYLGLTKSAEQALSAARAFAEGTHRYLVLVGPTGVGKSHLAAGAASARYDHDLAEWTLSAANIEYEARKIKAAPWERIPAPKGVPRIPEWQNVVELIVGLREDMGRQIDDKEWDLRPGELRNHGGVVVLDDLGREKVSDWTGETIYGLVNHRYEALLPTIVTTNLTGAELAASPYWPAVSRLAEDGALVKIDAPDHRLSRKASPEATSGAAGSGSSHPMKEEVT